MSQKFKIGDEVEVCNSFYRKNEIGTVSRYDLNALYEYSIIFSDSTEASYMERELKEVPKKEYTKVHLNLNHGLDLSGMNAKYTIPTGGYYSINGGPGVYIPEGNPVVSRDSGYEVEPKCAHQLKEYIGLMYKYNYCAHCGKKEGEL